MSNTGRIVPFKVDGFTVAILPEAQKAQSAALVLCGSIKSILNDEQQDAASRAASEAKGIFADAELTRKSVKEPFLRASQLIDQTAKNFAEPLEKEVKRIERLLGDYQQDKRRRAEEEQRKREWEAGAAQREAAAKQAEAERAAAEAERLAREAEALKGRKKAEAERIAAESLRQSELARKAAAAAEFAAAEASEEAHTIVAESPKPIGARVTPDQYEVEVTNIEALVRYALEAGKLEELLKIEPRMKNLKDYIFFHCKQQAVPGTTVREITRVNVKATPVGIPMIQN